MSGEFLAQGQACGKHMVVPYPFEPLFLSWPLSPHRIALTIRGVRVQEHFEELALPQDCHPHSPLSLTPHRGWDMIEQLSVCRMNDGAMQ